MSELAVEFPVDHPCGAGHFPGNPIIPGALLLAEVLGVIATQLALDGTWQVKNAKFPNPVRPGEQVEIDFSQSEPGTVRFEGAVAGNKVLSGAAYLSPFAGEGLES